MLSSENIAFPLYVEQQRARFQAQSEDLCTVQRAGFILVPDPSIYSAFLPR
jgi:hypothetical protein